MHFIDSDFINIEHRFSLHSHEHKKSMDKVRQDTLVWIHFITKYKEQKRTIKQNNITQLTEKSYLANKEQNLLLIIKINK